MVRYEYESTLGRNENRGKKQQTTVNSNKTPECAIYNMLYVNGLKPLEMQRLNFQYIQPSLYRACKSVTDLWASKILSPSVTG